MNIEHWLKNKKLSFKIGLMLGILHLLFSIYIAHYAIVWSSNAQWQFAWILPFALDIPVSLLYILIFFLPFHNIHFAFLPYPISDLRGFLLPLFLHGIIGTAWYFYLPTLVSKLFSKRGDSGKKGTFLFS